MITQLFRSKVTWFLLLCYVFLVGFLVWINVQGLREGMLNNLYGALYPIISLTGGLYGLFVVSRKWGGFRSLVGRGISFLSIGLLWLTFGQLVWSYYSIILNVEVPYPSLADLGYVLVIPSYAYAMFNFAKASGVSVSMRSFSGKIQALAVPLLMLAVAYFLFLRDLPVDFSQPIRTFLDWGTPAFDAVGVSIGILTYSLSRNILGGRMKKKVLFLIFALIVEFLAEYSFLYLAGVDQYYNAGPVDLLFTTSILIMSLGVLLFDETGS